MELAFKKTGEGRTLLILHGLLGMGDNWASISRAYADAGFKVFVPDLRNHGRSPHHPEFNYEVMASDVSEFVEQQQLEKISIIGHSMGGKVAIYLASLNPEKTEKLIVVDIAPKYYPPHHQSVFSAIHALNQDHLSSRKSAEEILRTSLSEESTIQFLLKNLYWKEENLLDWRFNAEVIEKNIDNIGKAIPENFQIDTPTLFIRGERSGYIRVEDEAAIKKQFSDVSFVSIPHAGHWVHAENPQDFLRESLLFLNRK
ncbi:MAG: alpha/beta fold hydrolase [Bacteroidia bacterium]|nr:alpha/beta fold hydrolase [Bacteroidia bacterium]